MTFYLDASALVKLVQREQVSHELRRFLRRHREVRRATSALSRVEVVRAVATGGAGAVAHAWRLLARVHQVVLDQELLDAAAVLAPGTPLRSLDAIHLASASMLGSDLRSVVTYDVRMQDAAHRLGLAVDAPS